MITHSIKVFLVLQCYDLNYSLLSGLDLKCSLLSSVIKFNLLRL